MGTTALLLTSGYMVVTTPADYDASALWNCIFVKLVPMSTDVRGDLGQLGLDERFQRFSGKNAYQFVSMEEYAFWIREFVRETSYRKVLLYYLKRPHLSVDRLFSAIRESWEMRPPYFGNFERSAGLPPMAKSDSFGWWSSSKRRLGTHYPAVPLGALACGAVVIGLAARHVSRGFAFGWLVVAAATGEFLVGAFADGMDFGRHLLLAQTLLDIYCCFLVAAIVPMLAGAFEAPKVRQDQHSRTF